MTFVAALLCLQVGMCVCVCVWVITGYQAEGSGLEFWIWDSLTLVTVKGN